MNGAEINRGPEQSPLDGAQDFAGADSPPDPEQLSGRIFLKNVRERGHVVVDAVGDATASVKSFLDKDPRGQRIKAHIQDVGRTWEATPKGEKIAITVFAAGALTAAVYEHYRKGKKKAR